MNIEQWLLHMGCRTYTDTYFTQLKGQPGVVKIGQDMPKPVGWIYGISIETDSVFPTDQTIPTITLAQASLLYLYFKVGKDLFINNARCDKFVFYVPPTGAGQVPQYTNQQRYFPVNIPDVTDLKQSYYQNPTGIGASPNVYIPLTIWYIDIDDYHQLLGKGYIFNGTRALPHHPKHSPKHGTLKNQPHEL